MYVYVCNNIYDRAAAYSLDCHGGAIVNHKLYRTFQSSIEHRTVLLLSRATFCTVLFCVICAFSSLGCSVSDWLERWPM